MRKRLVSRVLEKAEQRVAGLKSIDPNFMFDNNLNLQVMEQKIEQLRSSMKAYNNALSMLETSRNELKELEKKLNEFSQRMLLGIAVKYGLDSYEYQMAGGVRKSDRIRRSRINRIKANAKKKAQKS
jgi:hypothetical protein